MSDTDRDIIEDALKSDPSWWLSSIPTPPFDVQRICENWFALVNEVKRLQVVERELAIEKSEKLKYRERAWRAESELEMRYGLRKEINEALGLTDETGDDALRKGLETIKSIKAQLEAMTKRADEMERLKEHNGEMFYRVEQERDALKAKFKAAFEMHHDWCGLCPDRVVEMESRDPDCPACKALTEVMT